MQDVEIRSVLVPLTELDLLLPNATVAEVVNYAEPEPVPGAAGWLLGTVLWQGWQVPLISFVRLVDQNRTEAVKNTRMCIIKSLINNERMPYFAILAQSHPRLVTVTEDNLVETSTEGNPIGVAGYVTVDGREAAIPDLDRLGHLIAHAAFGALPLTS
ncbi:chemotaxis protein CheW [Wenzhouxiangella sp. AB-CW3]|uniref:chemotaxis protein CheW n=1 Tax=Wenzhouxiangella sp. AB-CW3 TaxID=2771012 RepID=UPI00168B1208|nr:chemotaxis protein CheW [Wenzhouxiangella sp. AB-CW3]QOC22962.1 chemotaxis protein CheW [Wenzhouxiangella sp. AB-CW3]